MLNPLPIKRCRCYVFGLRESLCKRYDSHSQSTSPTVRAIWIFHQKSDMPGGECKSYQETGSVETALDYDLGIM
jgi:hypothetical protein